MAQSDSGLMELMRAFLFAQTDGGHFHQTTLDRSMKICVRLDSVDQHDSIRAGSVPILKNAKFPGSAQLDHIHAAADGDAYGFLGDAIVGQNVQLPFSRRAAMA